MKTKILYVITKSNFGGAQRYVFDLATNLPKDKFEVVVALGGNGILKTKLESAGIRTAQINSLRRDISVIKDTSSFFRIFSIIKNEKPNIVHLNSPKVGGLGAFACFLLNLFWKLTAENYKLKAIQTVHGWTFNENRPLWQKIVIAKISWLTMLLCNKTIVIAKREYDQACKFPFVKNKLELVPLGIKPPPFFSREEARHALKIPQDTFVIGTIAELHPNKGLKYLADAMVTVVKTHPETICVIVGDGQDRNELEEHIKRNGLENKVSLAGYIENAANYLKAFDIFVLPSLKEGLPYVVLEAGLASLPVVATNVGGIPEIIKNGKSGVIIQPKNSKQLASEILNLIENEHKRHVYGAAILERVSQNFSFDKMLASTMDLYCLLWKV